MALADATSVADHVAFSGPISVISADPTGPLPSQTLTVTTVLSISRVGVRLIVDFAVPVTVIDNIPVRIWDPKHLIRRG